jgi:ribulose-5-phosphate 4-epimerase/fuculose-1-phosphate aldolase
MSMFNIRHTTDNLPYHDERVDMAAAFRWTARLKMHEAVANHFSLAVNPSGTQFLMNPNQKHFSLIKASDLLLLDAHDRKTMEHPDAPDPTAWAIHSAVHRQVPHARCVMHVHSIYATVLASLADSRLVPVDQNTAMFFNRIAIDENYGGFAFDEEGERVAALLQNPKHSVLIMGNHGVLVLGKDVADTFNRMYYFERAAETYIKALQTGQKLRVLSDEIAAKVADENDIYPQQAIRHFEDLKTILRNEESDFAN